MKRTAKLLNLLLSGLACALANKLRATPVASEDDKKETPIIFKIRRWRMGAFNKMCIALVSVCFLLSCAVPLQQITQQIQCTGPNGQILYAGPYNEESMGEYIVQVDDFTQAVYSKGACRKLQA